VFDQGPDLHVASIPRMASLISHEAGLAVGRTSRLFPEVLAIDESPNMLIADRAGAFGGIHDPADLRNEVVVL
jgi:hypothetical protein